MALPPSIPVLAIDARDRESAKAALVRVTEYALEQIIGGRESAPASHY